VLHVAAEQVERRKRLPDEFLTGSTHDPKARESRGELDDAVGALLRQPDRFLACQNMKIVALDQAVCDVEGPSELLSLAFGSLLQPGQDERGARLVDEHTVSFVDDCKMQPAQQEALGSAGGPSLDYLVEQEARAGPSVAQCQTIAQIVEHQLLVRAVGDVAHIGLLPVSRPLALLDKS